MPPKTNEAGATNNPTKQEIKFPIPTASITGIFLYFLDSIKKNDNPNAHIKLNKPPKKIFPEGLFSGGCAFKITTNTPTKQNNTASQVKVVVFSFRIIKPNIAAIIGIVANVLKTTVIDVSIVAKLNEILLIPDDSNKSKNGIETAFPRSFLIDRPEITNQANNKVTPISAPRDMVRPQPSRPDSLIKSVSGVIISAPNDANPTPNQGLPKM